MYRMICERVNLIKRSNSWSAYFRVGLGLLRHRVNSMNLNFIWDAFSHMKGWQHTELASGICQRVWHDRNIIWNTCLLYLLSQGQLKSFWWFYFIFMSYWSFRKMETSIDYFSVTLFPTTISEKTVSWKFDIFYL